MVISRRPHGWSSTPNPPTSKMAVKPHTNRKPKMWCCSICREVHFLVIVPLSSGKQHVLCIQSSHHAWCCVYSPVTMRSVVYTVQSPCVVLCAERIAVHSDMQLASSRRQDRVRGYWGPWVGSHDVLSFWHATVRVGVACDLFLLPYVCEVCVIYGGGFERTGLHIMQDCSEMNKRKFGMSQETIKTDGLDVIVWRRWQWDMIMEFVWVAEQKLLSMVMETAGGRWQVSVVKSEMKLGASFEIRLLILILRAHSKWS